MRLTLAFTVLALLVIYSNAFSYVRTDHIDQQVGFGQIYHIEVFDTTKEVRIRKGKASSAVQWMILTRKEYDKMVNQRSYTALKKVVGTTFDYSLTNVTSYVEQEDGIIITVTNYAFSTSRVEMDLTQVFEFSNAIIVAPIVFGLICCGCLCACVVGIVVFVVRRRKASQPAHVYLQHPEAPNATLINHNVPRSSTYESV
jgi:uncharacterized iron-regulated membrane protein